MSDTDFENMELHAQLVHRWCSARAAGLSDEQIEHGVRGMLAAITGRYPYTSPIAEDIISKLRADAEALGT